MTEFWCLCTSKGSAPTATTSRWRSARSRSAHPATKSSESPRGGAPRRPTPFPVPHLTARRPASPARAARPQVVLHPEPLPSIGAGRGVGAGRRPFSSYGTGVDDVSTPDLAGPVADGGDGAGRPGTARHRGATAAAGILWRRRAEAAPAAAPVRDVGAAVAARRRWRRTSRPSSTRRTG